MADTDRLQFCNGGDDITSDFYCDEDATEVRVWDAEGHVLVAVLKMRSPAGTRPPHWRFKSSEYGPDPSWDTDAQFDSWQEALDAFGFGALVR